ncbi:hypothetical protein V1277_003254 [Bradyrhizobium sp. AZCC 1588]|uniref:hypothetical protein n=1 Tax=unclassified Bradyrhizobium TaxID=2631580 RepID=UPI002FF3F9FD
MIDNANSAAAASSAAPAGLADSMAKNTAPMAATIKPVDGGANRNADHAVDGEGDRSVSL